MRRCDAIRRIRELAEKYDCDFFYVTEDDKNPNAPGCNVLHFLIIARDCRYEFRFKMDITDDNAVNRMIDYVENDIREKAK